MTPENGDDKPKSPLEETLFQVALIHMDFLRDTRHVGTVPKVTSDVIDKIRPQLNPLIIQESSRQTNKALELGVSELVNNLARDFEEVGPSFKSGAGFACLVYKRLNEEGFNFPAISEQTVESFEQKYDHALTKYAQYTETPVKEHQTRNGFLKGMLLMGFLAHELHSEENPDLFKIFADFSSSRRFAMEGCVLVYLLKTAQYLQSQREQS